MKKYSYISIPIIALLLATLSSTLTISTARGSLSTQSEVSLEPPSPEYVGEWVAEIITIETHPTQLTFGDPLWNPKPGSASFTFKVTYLQEVNINFNNKDVSAGGGIAGIGKAIFTPPSLSDLDVTSESSAIISYEVKDIRAVLTEVPILAFMAFSPKEDKTALGFALDADNYVGDPELQIFIEVVWEVVTHYCDMKGSYDVITQYENAGWASFYPLNWWGDFDFVSTSIEESFSPQPWTVSKIKNAVFTKAESPTLNPEDTEEGDDEYDISLPVNITPGFELILIICAIGLILLFWKRKKGGQK